jgi:hypothetical protein
VKLALFALVVLLPVAALAWVYYDFKSTGGIRQGVDGYKIVDLKAMSDFPFDNQAGTLEDVPEIYRGLDGQKVELVGEMWTGSTAASRVTDFSLVYSIADCCYTDEPQVQHFVDARVIGEDPVKFYRSPVRVRGTLHVDVQTRGGRVTSVYQLDVENVEPA